MNSRTLMVACLALLLSPLFVQADYITSFAYTDRAVYTGSFTRHATLGDAQSGANPVSGAAVIPNELSVFFVRNIPSGIGPHYDMLVDGGVGGNTAQFLNQWFYDAAGIPNPNNNDNAFIQIDDYDGSTPVTQRGYWTNNSFNTFRLEVTGQNALATPGDPNGEPDRSRFAQLGNIPATNLNGFGNWVSYSVDMTFGGLNGFVDNSIAPGFIRSNGDPTSINGTFTGVFVMNDQSPNQYYNVSLNLSLGNTYGFVNANTLDPNSPYLASTFGSATVVPAPPAAILAGIGLIGVFFRVRK